MSFLIHRPTHDLAVAAGRLAAIGREESTAAADLTGLRGSTRVVERGAQRFGGRIDAGLRMGNTDRPGHDRECCGELEGTAEKNSTLRLVHGSALLNRLSAKGSKE